MLAALIAGAVVALCPAVADAYQAGATVSLTPTTGPLPQGFLGLALEYNTIPRWVGDGIEPVDPVLLRLIRNLNPSGRPVIRLGGESTDRSWWPAPGVPAPLGVTYALNAEWARSAHALARALNPKMLLGVNLEADSTRVSQVMADQLVNGIGRRYVSDLELGNEPALYPVVPWYKLVSGKIEPWYIKRGKPVFSRPLSYGPPQFIREVQRTLKVLPRVPIAGPEASRTPWMDGFSSLLRPGSPVNMLTSHAYGLNSCIHNPRSPAFPSVPNLVALTASRTLLEQTASSIATAHRHGATYRVDEMGSVTCNGKPGVSDTMGSALWVLDSLFALASSHVDGVNLHSYQNSANGLFDLSQSRTGWSANVHPLYYGALMFARAAPAGSRLIQVHATKSPGLRVWATHGADRRVRVVLINDNLTSEATATVNPPPGYGGLRGALQILQASSAYATDGVTLGAQSFGTATATGALPAPVPLFVGPGRGGYRVTLHPGTAALLTLSRRR